MTCEYTIYNIFYRLQKAKLSTINTMQVIFKQKIALRGKKNM